MEDASFSYAGGHSGTGVEGISLSLGRGEVALLCGPSGCGKTTVTRLANGLAPHFYEGAETGTVRVCGLDIAHAELRETARLVGSVFQNPKTQFYSVDVRGEVAFGCENLGFKPADIERQVDAAAREFDLAPLIDESLFLFRAVRSSAWRARAPQRHLPHSSCWTNRRPTSTSRRSRSFARPSRAGRPKGSPRSWQSIGSITSRELRITCSTSTTAASRADGRPASSRVSTMPSACGSGCAREASTTSSKTTAAAALRQSPARKRQHPKKIRYASRA